MTRVNEDKVEDSYLRYFLSCNDYITYQEITDYVVVADEQNRGNFSAFSLEVFLSVLKKLGIMGYFYSKCSNVNGVSCVFTKYISPDLFLHMDNSKNINLKNRYSENFESSILSSRLETMVPFP